MLRGSLASAELRIEYTVYSAEINIEQQTTENLPFKQVLLNAGKPVNTV